MWWRPMNDHDPDHEYLRSVMRPAAARHVPGWPVATTPRQFMPSMCDRVRSERSAVEVRVLRTKFVLEHLAAHGLGQGVSEHDSLGRLVAAEPVPAEGDDLGLA